MRAALGRLFAMAIPVFVVAQFLLAGLGVFADGAAWDLHRTLGTAMALPVSGLAVLAWTTPVLLPLRGPASVLAGLYVMQFGWLGLGAALDIPALRAMHAPNGLAIAATGDLLLRRLRRPAAALG